MISAAAALVEMLVVLDNFDINLHHFHIARLTEKLLRIMGLFDNLAFDTEIFTIFREDPPPYYFLLVTCSKHLDRTEKILKATWRNGEGQRIL